MSDARSTITRLFKAKPLLTWGKTGYGIIGSDKEGKFARIIQKPSGRYAVVWTREQTALSAVRPLWFEDDIYATAEAAEAAVEAAYRERLVGSSTSSAQCRLTLLNQMYVIYGFGGARDLFVNSGENTFYLARFIEGPNGFKLVRWGHRWPNAEVPDFIFQTLHALQAYVAAVCASLCDEL